MSAPLTWLYVPADRPDRVVKALASSADVVILDLEDAVAPAAKAAARETVSRTAPSAAAAGRAVQVRVNAAGTPWYEDDLALVAGLPDAVGVRVPKCEGTGPVVDLADRVGGRAVHMLLESAAGVEMAAALASAHPAVATIGLGEADLRADLGVADEDGLLWCRSRVVVAAAAARLPPPAMSVFPQVRDLDGLADSCRRGRALGFLGRAVIHPAQLPVVVEAFRPSQDEVARAHEVVAAAEAAGAAGHGAVALPDGRFVDEAVVRWARRILDLDLE